MARYGCIEAALVVGGLTIFGVAVSAAACRAEVPATPTKKPVPTSTPVFIADRPTVTVAPSYTATVRAEVIAGQSFLRNTPTSRKGFYEPPTPAPLATPTPIFESPRPNRAPVQYPRP